MKQGRLAQQLITPATSGAPNAFKNKLVLSDFQGFDNPRAGNILQSIYSVTFSTVHDDYFVFFKERIEMYPEMREFLSRKLAGEVVVDLGCGNENIPHAARFLETLGASVYIGVDRIIRNPYQTAEEHGLEKIALLLDDSDMLRFVSNLPSGSVNFMLNGIDALVFTAMGGVGRYQEHLSEEIARATKNGGLVFGRGSEPIEEDLRGEPALSRLFVDLKRLVDPLDWSVDSFLFEKK
jgi:hypothetical protein